MLVRFLGIQCRLVSGLRSSTFRVSLDFAVEIVCLVLQCHASARIFEARGLNVVAIKPCRGKRFVLRNEGGQIYLAKVESVLQYLGDGFEYSRFPIVLDAIGI